MLDHIARELLRLAEGEIPDQQLRTAKEQLTLQYVLLNESPRHLTYFASRFIHATGAATSWTDLVPSLEAVDVDAIARLAGRLARGHTAVPEHHQRKHDRGDKDVPTTR